MNNVRYGLCESSEQQHFCYLRMRRDDQTQVVNSTSLSISVLAGTSTRSNRPHDTSRVFWSSLVNADIFRLTELVTLTLTSSKSVRSMYSEILRPPVKPKLSKEVSVLLWATIKPPVLRLKEITLGT